MLSKPFNIFLYFKDEFQNIRYCVFSHREQKIYNWKQETKGKGNTVSFLVLNNSFIGNTKLNRIQRIFIYYNCKIKGK